MNPVLLYIASAMTGLWGVAHLFATKGVVVGFGDITTDNRRIISMEWIVEGVALISTAAFVAAATAIQPEAPVSSAVYGGDRHFGRTRSCFFIYRLQDCIPSLQTVPFYLWCFSGIDRLGCMVIK